MSDDKFDAIVVGAGVAGSVAALVMARAGLDVLVIERGDSAGCKNMTGGRLYAHTLEAIIPGFAVSAPVERKVTREKISFLTEESAVTLDFHREQPDVPQHASYTVLRNRLDPWLMEQAEQAGAQFIPGVRVDALVREGNKVTGVQAGDDILEANVVILADGVNSMLGRSLGMVPASDPHHYAVGVKEVIGLTPEQINDRFNVTGEEGAAWLFAGSPSDGLMGGGFLYTNNDSVSLGLVCGLGDIAHAQKSVPQMLEDFKQHPAIRPLISGGKLLEYSAHMVPEGGLAMVPQLVNDGVIIVGDAAGFCLNLGFTVRGMDLAIASAQAAATTVIAAKERTDFSASSLAQYKRELEQSCVMRDNNNILASERAYCARLNLTWQDVFMMPAPLGHATGFLHGVTAPFLIGARSVLLDIFTPDACLALLEQQRCTCMLGATPFVYDLLNVLEKQPADLSALRFFLCGGTTIPKKVARECQQLGIKLLSVYGSTESSPHAVVNLDDPLSRFMHTDGYAAAGVEIKVVDDARKTLPPGCEGEEASRGPNVFMGYFDEPELTARALDEEGWYYSGDLCRMDEAGYIKITGRKKDIIVRGGENISSREVEDILLQHPKIHDACVVAMSDERLGERSCAYVVLKAPHHSLSLEEVVAFFSRKRVAKYKYPEHIVVIEKLPRTTSGKIQKFLLRKDIMRRLTQDVCEEIE